MRQNDFECLFHKSECEKLKILIEIYRVTEEFVKAEGPEVYKSWSEQDGYWTSDRLSTQYNSFFASRLPYQLLTNLGFYFLLEYPIKPQG